MHFKAEKKAEKEIQQAFRKGFEKEGTFEEIIWPLCTT